MADIGGFLLVDKPEDFTSHDVVNVVRRAFNIKKIGHSGTLDPFATGLLVLAIGKSTRLLQYVQSSKKEYEVEMVLGKETDTHDHTGEIINESQVPNLDEEQIRKTISSFTGTQNQVPPKYSAIKIKGKKAYEYARSGEEVKLPTREVTISDIQIHEIDLPSIRFKVSCTSGTYIRSLVRDIGRTLGTYATTTSLRRTMVGEMNVEDAIKLQDIKDGKIGTENIIEPMKVLGDQDSFEMSDEELKEASFGRAFSLEKLYPIDAILFGVHSGILVGIFKVIQSENDKEKVKAKPEKIFV